MDGYAALVAILRRRSINPRMAARCLARHFRTHGNHWLDIGSQDDAAEDMAIAEELELFAAGGEQP